MPRAGFRPISNFNQFFLMLRRGRVGSKSKFDTKISIGCWFLAKDNFIVLATYAV